MAAPQSTGNGPPAAVFTSAHINPLLTRYRVPAAFLARSVGITETYLYRIKAGRVPLRLTLALAFEAIANRWEKEPPRYVHANSNEARAADEALEWRIEPLPQGYGPPRYRVVRGTGKRQRDTLGEFRTFDEARRKIFARRG